MRRGGTEEDVEETYDVKITVTLKFTNASVWTMDQEIERETEEESEDKFYGTYEVNGNSINLIFDEESGGYEYEGTINGDKLVFLYMPHPDGTEGITFTKQ
jgi:hypothetical protein